MSLKLGGSIVRLHTSAVAASSGAVSSHRLVGPAVKFLLHNYQLDVSKLSASGPKKNLLKGDVLVHINRHKLTPKKPSALRQPENGAGAKAASKTSKAGAQQLFAAQTRNGQKYSDIPLSNERQTAAKRFVLSKQQIPHSYLAATVEANALLALKKRFRELSGADISLGDFVVKACSIALTMVPEMNVRWKENDLMQSGTIDISIVVPTENGEGAISPILYKTDQLSVEQIARKVGELAERAREGKIKANECQGGSFAISNFGMFEVAQYTGIIASPQTAVLTVGGLDYSVSAIGEKEEEKDGRAKKMEFQRTFTLTLCYDMRAIDDLIAQRFLAHLRTLLGNPETMLSALPASFGGCDEIDEVEEEDECTDFETAYGFNQVRIPQKKSENLESDGYRQQPTHHELKDEKLMAEILKLHTETDKLSAEVGKFNAETRFLGAKASALESAKAHR